MARRCPDARLIGKSEVNGYELFFKGSKTGAYATIEKKKDSVVPVLVWEITKTDERNLDRYEGFPIFYYKKSLDVIVKGERLTAMVYIMNESRKLGIPSNTYFGILDAAYCKFGFDYAILAKAYEVSVKNSYSNSGIK